jgi:hypothetical protein
MAVISDLIEGTLSHDGSGWQDRRLFMVTDVTGANPAARKYTAINHPDIPRRGDAHPGGVPGCTVQSIDCEPESGDNTKFRVTVQYGGDSAGSAESLQGSGIKALEISTSTLSKETTRDINGRRMQVTYTGETYLINLVGYESPQEFTPTIVSQIGVAEYDEVLIRASVTVERTIPSLSENFAVAGRVNASRWSGSDPYTWLCVGVDSSVGSNGRHDWRYQLAYLKEGWRFEASVGKGGYLGGGTIGTNYVASDIRVGNGIEFFDLYEPYEFRSLGFEIPR